MGCGICCWKLVRGRMRRRLLLGITISLCAYVLLGGVIFHVLESNHEDETINETLDAYYDLLREYIIYDIRKIIEMCLDIWKLKWVNGILLLMWWICNVTSTVGYTCTFSLRLLSSPGSFIHDDVIKWKHFPRYWPFVRGIHRSPVNSPHKGLWRGALMFSLICAWINRWVNNREAGDLRRYCAHYDLIVMSIWFSW